MNLVRKSLMAAAVPLVMTAATGEAQGAADPTGTPAICHSTTEDGAETDTCVGNPAASSGPDDAARGVVVRPEFCLGIGIAFFGNCGDD
ncbi:hypothetical protein [Mycobacterium sp.]|uniref:hypothetical protein n=1 Tax=Mycobacterium sp. TaxID=1785 RepID=UPI002D3DA0D2|nr:hypothetical protein [Mycobacterium sp.]HZA10223.1 hypothetical protein [Mycobacterium sp.]